MTFLSFTTGPEFWALLTLVATGAGSAATFALTKYFELKTKAMEREQARLDKEQSDHSEAEKEARHLAAIASVSQEADLREKRIIDEGSKREKRIIKEVVDVKKTAQAGIRMTVEAVKTNKEAVEASNGIKVALAESGVMLIPVSPKNEEPN